jgi:cell division protein FtsB
VTRKSNDNFTDGESEALFQKFLDYLDEAARREYSGIRDGGLINEP